MQSKKGRWFSLLLDFRTCQGRRQVLLSRVLRDTWSARRSSLKRRSGVRRRWAGCASSCRPCPGSSGPLRRQTRRGPRSEASSQLPPLCMKRYGEAAPRAQGQASAVRKSMRQQTLSLANHVAVVAIEGTAISFVNTCLGNGMSGVAYNKNYLQMPCVLRNACDVKANLGTSWSRWWGVRVEGVGWKGGLYFSSQGNI